MINRKTIYLKLGRPTALLTPEEFTALTEAMTVCASEDECIGSECPICCVKAGDEVDCCTLFAQYAKTLRDMRIKSGNLVVENEESNLKELADNAIKICNEIKIKTKRETPMDIVLSRHNGKFLYSCKNCGKPLFIQASTQYCECCGQRLKFEG